MLKPSIGGAVVIVAMLACPRTVEPRLRLVEFDRCLLFTASDWWSFTMFAMYNLRVAEFDDVCYVQPPVGGV
ncbi:hypothetical protein H5410_005041 [Solanum commersonii]|uniref:Uncharacterized protein n=1 Tax=Solanum commersonii TaxID=4109 RepID=A0A9J6A703_SOLCO|nr:hypothetical protein H5410_005041 [Solanum commersonii]